MIRLACAAHRLSLTAEASKSVTLNGYKQLQLLHGPMLVACIVQWMAISAMPPSQQP